MSTTQTSDWTPDWTVEGVQREFCESTARYRTLVAGRRYGKNHTAITSQADFVLDPASYPLGRDDPERVMAWWVGPTYNQTKKYGFHKAKEALPDEVIADTRATQPFEIHLTNGATWEFYSFDRPKSLDGAGVDDMVIDERGYMLTDIWEDNLAAMLLDTNGRVAFIGKAWPNDHFQQCFEKGQDPAFENYDSWHATSYDSPRIPGERIDELFGDLPERIFRREILAEFEAGGNFLTREMLEFVHVSEMPDDREYAWHVAADLAVEADPASARDNDTDYWAAAVVAYDAVEQQAYLVDVARTRGMTKDQGVGWLSAIMDGLPTNKVGIESVQAQRWFVQDARDAGLRAYEIENTRNKEERLTYLSVPFANGSVKLVNHDDPADRAPGQEFDPRWEAFISEWIGFPTASHDDLLDATEMALREVNLGGGIGAVESGDAYGERQ